MTLSEKCLFSSIWTEYKKIPTRKNSVFGYFSRKATWQKELFSLSSDETTAYFNQNFLCRWSSQLKLRHSKEEIKKSGCISELTVDGQCNPPDVSATHNTVCAIDAGKSEVRIFMVVHVKLLETTFIGVDCYF